MNFKLPELPYAFDALEPHIDARTMEIHYGKHHQAYVNGLNEAISGHDISCPCVDELLASIYTLPEEIRSAVRNFGGGHANHCMFWTMLTPGGSDRPMGELLSAIDDELGGFDHLREQFTRTAMRRFGSGWAWLCLDVHQRLVVESTPNQDSPLMHGHTPILGIDLWEHAYYLKYQNRRDEYLKACCHVVNWDIASKRYTEAVQRKAHPVTA